MKLISIVIPCYNSEATIRKVVEMVMEEFKKMDGYDCEFVLVNDGSPKDNTYGEIKKLGEQYQNVKGINLLRNFGQHNALMAALHYTEGDFILGMDDDMQTHPSQLGKLLDEFDKGYDIVYGYYEHKEHSKFRNFGSYVNYMTVRILLKKPKDLKTSSFWVIRKFVRDYAVEYKSAYTHLQGLFLRTTRNISSVPIQHFKREVGTSNYTLKKLIKLWSNILGFSIVPLQMATYTGFFSDRNSGGNWSHYFEICAACNLYWLAVYDGNHLFLLRTESDVHGDHWRICGKNILGNEQKPSVCSAPGTSQGRI